MESQQSARFQRLVLVGLVMLAAIPGMAVPVPEARAILNTDRYVVGSHWTLDILVDTPEALSVKVPVPVLPPALVLADGPYIRETSWEKVPGTLSRATKVTFGFRTQAPGIVEVGPFEVRVGTLAQTLPAITVYLLAADEAKRRFPVEVGWVKPVGPFYVGQAIPLILQARNLDTLAQPQDFGLVAPTGSLVEKTVGLGEIEINSVGEDRLMNIPWGGWMMIPTKPGTLTLGPLKAVVTGLNRVVAPLSLEILPLPPEASLSRAVGDFSYAIEAKQGESSQKGQLVVTQSITGRGNFPYLVLPTVAIPALTMISRQEGTQYRSGLGGYEGSFVVTWRFASDRAQTVTVTLPGFQAFQPSTGRVNVWDDKTVAVPLTLPSVVAPTASTTQPLTWAEVQAVRPWPLTRGWLAGLFFLPGPLLLLSTFFLRGKGRGLLILLVFGIVLVGANQPPPAGFDDASKASGASAAELWRNLAVAHTEEPGLWYNAALACRDAGRTAEAVHAFRMALWDGFQGDRAAKALSALEEKELLTDQFVPWNGWPTNLLFLFFCIVVNVTFAFWAFQRIAGASFWLMPLSVAVLASAALGVFIIGAETDRLEADAVVGVIDSPIRKVPGGLAESWMTLKAGTVVRVQGASDRWVLVQTGYGLEGWVEASTLMPVPGKR